MLIIDKEVVENSPTTFAGQFITNNTIHQMRGWDGNKFSEKLVRNRQKNEIHYHFEHNGIADNFHTDDPIHNKQDKFLGESTGVVLHS